MRAFHRKLALAVTLLLGAGGAVAEEGTNTFPGLRLGKAERHALAGSLFLPNPLRVGELALGGSVFHDREALLVSGSLALSLGADWDLGLGWLYDADPDSGGQAGALLFRRRF